MNPQIPTSYTKTQATKSAVDLEQQIRRRASNYTSSAEERTGMI